MTRTLILFKVGGEVVLEKTQPQTLNNIEITKGIIAFECGCEVDDIEVVVEHSNHEKELSDIDVNSNGLIFWKDVFPELIVGVKLTIPFGSDEYLDAVNENKLINKLIMFC